MPTPILTVNWQNVVGGVPQQVQVVINATLDDGTTFCDALYYPTVAAYNAAHGAGSVDADAQARVDNHITTIQPADPPDAATQLQQLTDAIAQTDAARADLMGQLKTLIAPTLDAVASGAIAVQPEPVQVGAATVGD